MGQGLRFLATTFADLVIAPISAVCPECQRASRRTWKAKRFAIDTAKDGISALRITVGVYRCKSCRHYFRNQPAFLRKSATYSNNVMTLALASVQEDGMPISRVPRRLSRDFGIKPS
jgi:transposase